MPASRDDPAWLRPMAAARAAPVNKATVYLGSDLMARVQELRARGIDINVSKVCQLALEQAIGDAERMSWPTPRSRQAAKRSPPTHRR